MEFECSDWDNWFELETNAKYLCKSPCKSNDQIIITAEPGETKHKDGIQLTNTGEVLHVKFTNPQKSDSGIYYCGVRRTFKDSFIKVELQVTEGKFMLHMLFLPNLEEENSK